MPDTLYVECRRRAKIACLRKELSMVEANLTNENKQFQEHYASKDIESAHIASTLLFRSRQKLSEIANYSVEVASVLRVIEEANASLDVWISTMQAEYE